MPLTTTPLAMTFRPLDGWPGPMTEDRRPATFTANWDNTRRLLHRELVALDATAVVIQVAVTQDAIRVDGSFPRADAKPTHPGVVLAFSSIHGPLQYAADRYQRNRYMDGWQANVRAIGLGLQALRAVDRYGITSRGEQYTGWAALPASTSSLTRESALELIAEWADNSHIHTERWDINRAEQEPALAWQKARHNAHPDRFGSDQDFLDVTEAGVVLGVA